MKPWPHDKPKDNRIVWVDLETTGLDAQFDCILEVGVIVTDGELEELGSRSWIVRPRSKTAWERMPEFVQSMHEDSGLYDEIDINWYSLPAVAEVSHGVREFVTEMDAVGAPLAGSTIEFDMRFMLAWMPSLFAEGRELFHYHTINVTSLKRIVTLWGGKEWTVAGKKEHRALPDLRGSIDELKAYRRRHLRGTPYLDYIGDQK